MEILYTIDELAYADHIAVAYLSGVSKAMGHESHFCSIDRMNLSDKVREVRPDIIAYSFHNSGFDDIVASHSLYSIIDLRTGYWQILMEKVSRPMTAFVCHRGLFEFLFC